MPLRKRGIDRRVLDDLRAEMMNEIDGLKEEILSEVDARIDARQEAPEGDDKD